MVPSMMQFTQGDPNLTADWRLKENADGTVQFESVVCQGACVGINQGGTLIKNISIFLVVSPHQLTVKRLAVYTRTWIVNLDSLPFPIRKICLLIGRLINYCLRRPSNNGSFSVNGFALCFYNTECPEVWRCRDHHKVSKPTFQCGIYYDCTSYCLYYITGLH